MSYFAVANIKQKELWLFLLSQKDGYRQWYKDNPQPKRYEAHHAVPDYWKAKYQAKARDSEEAPRHGHVYVGKRLKR